MTYEIQIDTEGQRITFIGDQVRQSENRWETWDLYPGRKEALKVITLPIGMPLYRMANGRTKSEQMQLIQDQNFDETFFDAGQENESVQQLQHDLLVRLSKQSADGTGDSIYDVLLKNPQKEPLLISPSGVVLNGNRRLAAMRDIQSSNPAEFMNFTHVTCAVLPQLTPQQEIDLELKLQMSQNFKLEYSWVDEALMIEEAKKYHTVAELCEMMSKSKQHLNMMTRALQEAQLYLQVKEKKPHSYGLVQNKFQLFKDLQKFTKELPESKAQSVRHIAWNLSDANLEDRLYGYNFLLTDRSEDLVNEVIKASGSVNSSVPLDNEDLEISLGDEPDVYDTFNSLIESGAANNSGEIVRLIENIAEKLKADEDAKKTGLDPLKLASEIHTKLEKLNVTIASEGTKEALVAQLESIRDKAENLIRIAEQD
jgi:DNA-binding transcriptional regulator GbsR (MarR family)